MKDTLCWRCEKAINGCPWSRSGTPIKNWKATPTIIKNGKGWETHSFCIHECPLFVEDIYIGCKVSTMTLSKMLSVSQRTLFRKSEKWLTDKVKLLGYRLIILREAQCKSYFLLKIKL